MSEDDAARQISRNLGRLEMCMHSLREMVGSSSKTTRARRQSPRTRPRGDVSHRRLSPTRDASHHSFMHSRASFIHRAFRPSRRHAPHPRARSRTRRAANATTRPWATPWTTTRSPSSRAVAFSRIASPQTSHRLARATAPWPPRSVPRSPARWTISRTTFVAVVTTCLLYTSPSPRDRG